MYSAIQGSVSNYIKLTKGVRVASVGTVAKALAIGLAAYCNKRPGSTVLLDPLLSFQKTARQRWGPESVAVCLALL